MPEPTYGVRIERGLITRWRGEPILSYEMACEACEVLRTWIGAASVVYLATICKCGHSHDSDENNADVGCRVCECNRWQGIARWHVNAGLMSDDEGTLDSLEDARWEREVQEARERGGLT